MLEMEIEEVAVVQIESTAKVVVVIAREVKYRSITRYLIWPTRMPFRNFEPRHWLRRTNRLIPALCSRRWHFKTTSDTDIMAAMKKRTVSKTERLSRRNITDVMNWIERGERGKEVGQGKESWTW